MSRLSKILLVFVAVVFVLACNFVTQPIQDAKDLAETAQSVASLIPVETLQAIPSLIPAETLQALPSAIPTLESLASAVPNLGDIFNPQGTPVQEWMGIPIMPQATAGQEFSDQSTYSFKVNATTTEVQNFYNDQLTPLGWEQPLSIPVEEEGGFLIFQKEDIALTITLVVSEGITTVVLTLA